MLPELHHGLKGSLVTPLVFLVLVSALLWGTVGCQYSDDAVSGPDPEEVAQFLWPRGDGSAYFNVMEAGFFSAEPLLEPLSPASRPVTLHCAARGNGFSIINARMADGAKPTTDAWMGGTRKTAKVRSSRPPGPCSDFSRGRNQIGSASSEVRAS